MYYLLLLRAPILILRRNHAPWPQMVYLTLLNPFFFSVQLPSIRRYHFLYRFFLFDNLLALPNRQAFLLQIIYSSISIHHLKCFLKELHVISTQKYVPMFINLPKWRWLQLFLIYSRRILNHYSYNSRNKHSCVVQSHCAFERAGHIVPEFLEQTFVASYIDKACGFQQLLQLFFID